MMCEKEEWFDRFFVQKSKGEIKRSMVLLFVMFTAVIAVSLGIFGKAEPASAAILMWGTGDAAAALVGIPFGKHKIRLPFTDGKKSWEGSISMLLVSFLAGITLLLLTGTGSTFHILLSVALGALAGTVTELYSPSELDTVTVPVVILAVLLLFEFL